MTPLPLTFTTSDFQHEQIARTESHALYRRWKYPTKVHFEVIEIGKFQEKIMFDKKVEAHEFYPGAPAFGKSGWTFPTLELAQARYDELTKPFVKKVIKKKLSVD